MCLKLADVARLQLAVLAGRDLECHSLTFIKGLEALALDLAVVDEDIVSVFVRDETITLVSVEPLDSTFSHSYSSFRPIGARQSDVPGSSFPAMSRYAG